MSNVIQTYELDPMNWKAAAPTALYVWWAQGRVPGFDDALAFHFRIAALIQSGVGYH